MLITVPSTLASEGIPRRAESAQLTARTPPRRPAAVRSLCLKCSERLPGWLRGINPRKPGSGYHKGEIPHVVAAIRAYRARRADKHHRTFGKKIILSERTVVLLFRGRRSRRGPFV